MGCILQLYCGVRVFHSLTPLHSSTLCLCFYFIIAPPKVSASNRTLIIGYGGSISCSISGNVTRIMWYKNGSYIAKWKTGNYYFMCKVECSYRTWYLVTIFMCFLATILAGITLFLLYNLNFFEGCKSGQFTKIYVFANFLCWDEIHVRYCDWSKNPWRFLCSAYYNWGNSIFW